jgi:hydroxymethylglutaryl-CoA synthase
MALLGGNADVEGTTTLNACYGGTAALFNSAAWAASPEARGRLAVYVAADVAVYAPGAARPTGGAGAVAVLVGPRAPLALVPGVRASHSVDAYDFYKPDLASEYPAVDGKLSQVTYLEAVDATYNRVMAALGAVRAGDAFDRMAFHSPYNKLVQQSFRRCLFNDARRLVAAGAPLPPALAPLEPFARLPAAATLANKDLDRALAGVGAAEYAAAVGPTEGLSKAIGNSYAAALHANLLCLAAAEGEALAGKRVGAFSYGSGAIATFFALRGVTAPAGAEFSLGRIARAVDVPARLAARREAQPEELSAALRLREAAYGRSAFAPAGSVDDVPAGAFYLDKVLPAGQRVYARKP